MTVFICSLTAVLPTLDSCKHSQHPFEWSLVQEPVIWSSLSIFPSVSLSQLPELLQTGNVIWCYHATSSFASINFTHHSACPRSAWASVDLLFRPHTSSTWSRQSNFPDCVETSCAFSGISSSAAPWFFACLDVTGFWTKQNMSYFAFWHEGLSVFTKALHTNRLAFRKYHRTANVAAAAPPASATFLFQSILHLFASFVVDIGKTKMNKGPCKMSGPAPLRTHLSMVATVKSEWSWRLKMFGCPNAKFQI